MAWVPHAIRFAGELWLAPAEHQADVREADLAALAPALAPRPVRRPSATIGASPLNLWLHTAPQPTCAARSTGTSRSRRGAPQLAGFELGTDIAIMSADPVLEAAALRDALPV